MARLTIADLTKQLEVECKLVAIHEATILRLTKDRNELTEQLDRTRFDLQNYVQAVYNAQTLAKPTPTTQQRRVYEFNPAIPGDFARAAQLAKANKGSVKRMAV